MSLVRPFVDTLRHLRRGRSQLELSDHVHRLVDEVRQTGRPGKLLLELTVKPIKESDGQVFIEAAVRERSVA